jgi:hypothetical protein
MANPKILLSLLLAAAGCLLGLFPFLRPDKLYAAYAQISFYIILLLFIVWTDTLIRFLQAQKFSLRQWLRENRFGFLFAAFLSGVVFITVQSDFRLLNDEVHFVSISRAMVTEQRVDAVTEAEWVNEKLKPLNRGLTPKPLLFPFFIHLIHRVSGYRPENSFVLNFFILFLFLSLIFSSLKNRIGPLWASLALVFVAAQPVVTLTATSGIYDLLSVFFLGICFLSLNTYFKRQDEISFRFLGLTLFMFLHIRQEAVLAFAATLGGLLLLRALPLRFFKASVLYGLAPLFFLPLIWWHRLQSKPYKVFLQTAPHDSSFSISHSLKHSLEFLQSFVRFDFVLPYANPVCLLGLGALIFLGIPFMLSKNFLENRPKRNTVLIASFNILVFWFLFSSFHAGSPLSGPFSRYFLIFTVTLSIAAVFALKKIPYLNRPAAAIGFAVLVFLAYHPVAMRGKLIKEHSRSAHHYRLVRSMLRPYKDQKKFLISLSPYRYIIYNNAVITPGRANREQERLLAQIRKGALSNVYTIQNVHARSRKVMPEFQLSQGYKLTPLAERDTGRGLLIRLSKVEA